MGCTQGCETYASGVQHRVPPPWRSLNVVCSFELVRRCDKRAGRKACQCNLQASHRTAGGGTPFVQYASPAELLLSLGCLLYNTSCCASPRRLHEPPSRPTPTQGEHACACAKPNTSTMAHAHRLHMVRLVAHHSAAAVAMYHDPAGGSHSPLSNLIMTTVMSSR